MFAQPEVFDLIAQAFGTIFCAMEIFRVYLQPLPIVTRLMIGDERQRCIVSALSALSDLGHERLHHWVGPVAQFLGQSLNLRFGVRGDLGRISQRQGNQGTAYVRMVCNDLERHRILRA